MKQYTYPRIPEDDYRKARFQLQGAISVLLMPLRKYGQGEYVDGIIPEIVNLAEQFGMRIRGKEQPIIPPESYLRGEPDD